MFSADSVMAGMQRARLAGAALAIALTHAMGAWALQSEPVRDPPVHQVSLEQATQLLHERYGSQARVLRADVTDQDGHRVYVFRLLSVDGRIWIVRIDAHSGAELP